MEHRQDCCESVSIEDICGDLQDLIGSEIVDAYESTNEDAKPAGYISPVSDYTDDSETWTFYRIATAKGTVTIRWYGTSNGYYSVGVDFFRAK
jgi:hypothetical protein